MKYILTVEEVQTLAGMLGAERFFGFASPSDRLEREDIVRNVVQLYQRGTLWQDDSGMHCEPRVKELMQTLVSASVATVLFLPQQAHLCCYGEGGELTVLERIAERPEECKLYSRSLEELWQELAEEYLPEESAVAPVAPGQIPEELDFQASGDSEKICLQADIFSMDGECRIAKGLILREGKTYIQAFRNGENSRSADYSPEQFRQWLQRTIGGKEQ